MTLQRNILIGHEWRISFKSIKKITKMLESVYEISGRPKILTKAKAIWKRLILGLEQLKDIKAFGFSSSTEPILRKIRKSLNLIKLEKLDWKICSKWKSALLGVFAKFKIFREGQDTPNPGGVGVLYNQVHFACPNKLWICKYPKPCFSLCFLLCNWITKKWVLYQTKFEQTFTCVTKQSRNAL